MNQTNEKPLQYVAVEFHPGDRRSYTYHWSGEPLAVGARVLVPTVRGEATVEVISICPDKPRFPTKPVLGLAP